MECWKLLGIERTADKRKIKSAYAKLLKQNHPEDKPKEYQSIREAYEQALLFAEYMQRGEDEDVELSRNSALVPQRSENSQPVTEQSSPALRERERVRDIQIKRIDAALAKIIPLLQRDDRAAIQFCQSALSDDFFHALDVRYEFEGRLLVNMLQNDLMPFAFLKYLAQEFKWDIDLNRKGRTVIGHFDDDVLYSDAFYTVAERYLAQMVRNALRGHLQSTNQWLAVEQLDQIEELLFTGDRESELEEFCKTDQNRELIESAIAFLRAHYYISAHSSFVPRKTLQWLASQKVFQVVEPAQPIPYQPPTTGSNGYSIYRPLIWFLAYVVIVLLRFALPQPSSDPGFNRPTSTRSGSPEYVDVYSVSRKTVDQITRSQLGESDKLESLRWLQRAAKKGNERAREKLAILYYENAAGEKDYKLAVTMLTWAADQGRAEATYWLARVFEEGKAEKRDEDKARQLLDRAVELGSIDAMFVKGFRLVHGRGMEVDPNKGMELLQKAADQGNLKATYELAKGHLFGQTLELNYEQAFMLLERMSMRHVPIGQFWLSQLYEKGLGVSKDPTRAAQLLAEAKNKASWVTVNHFAWQLATQPNKQLRNGDLAVELMEHVVGQSQYTKAAWIDTLAAAYAEAGKFDKAIQAQQRALKNLPVNSTAEQRRMFEARLRLYQKNESL